MLRTAHYPGRGMAAGGSKISSTRRGAQTRQGAEARREGLAPLPSLQAYVPAIDTLEEISSWLGTFRERLRVARSDERVQVASVVQLLEARYQLRRAELS